MAKGVGRIKGGSKSKGKRWKKGQSCVTNPSVTTHRQAAAQNRLHPAFRTPNKSETKGFGLTEKALAHHNESQEDETMFEADGDAQSAGDTYKTFLSGVTDCSMNAFDKVKRYWESNAAQHKELCAVLAAVTEVIREKDGQETETEYFAALMTALESVTAGESLSAVVFLLSLIIKRVPPSVLRKKFSVVSKVFIDLLAANSATSAASLLRSALACLSTVLRVQELAVWSEPSTSLTYQTLLIFTIHHKPKVRKAAQHAVCAVLKGSQCMQSDNTSTAAHHPATAATSKFCVQQIEKHGGTGDATTTLHILGLLKDVMSTFPKNQLKTVCETILKVMTLSNVLITSVSMQALHSMFEDKPSSSCLPKELNAQLINALYDYQPGENDVQPVQAWLAVMQAAHVNLTRLDDHLCLTHLPRLFASCLTCFTSEKAEVAKSAAQALKTLLRECLQPANAWLSKEVSSGNTPVHKMFHIVEGALSYRYHSSWGLVLQVLNVFFETFGKEGHSFMTKCLQSMCDLRSTHHFPYTHELDKAVGMAIKMMGPRIVLEAVPLNITGEEDNYEFPRSWLLPVLRENICNTELQYFTKNFLPLAAKLRTRALEFEQEGRKVEAKTYDVLQYQIWNLLAGFCKGTTDVTQSFKGIARILGSALSERPDLKFDVCAGLRQIITSSMEDEDGKKEVGRFAKNFLPILFNMYTTGNPREDSSIFTVLETIKVYLKITDTELVGSLMEKISVKLSSDEKNKHPLMDLAIAMVPYLDEQHTESVYNLAKPLLQSKDHTIQKKSYRILEEICESKTESSKTFVKTRIQEIQDVLVKSLSSSSPSSKAPRLRCVLHVIKGLDEENADFLQTILPEIILCTKEVNSKTRALAFGVLSEIGRSMIRWSEGEDNKQICIGRYIESLAAGLAGSPHMISATVLALSSVIYEFKGVVSGSYLEQLIEGVCTLLQSSAREVLRSALGFVKVLSQILDQSVLAQHVEHLIESMNVMSEANRRALRVPIKSIYGRFLRKYGYARINKLVPEHHKKMLANMRKMEERKKKQRAVKDALDNPEDDIEESALEPSKPKAETIEEILQDSESEDDDEDKGQARGRKAKRPIAKRGKAWLKEGADTDAPLDFLDPSISKRVLATQPAASKGKDGDGGKGIVKHNFKTMPDGRLFISEDKAEDEEKEKRGGGGGGGKRKRTMVGLVDELEMMMDEELAQQKKGGKKRRMEDLSISDDEDQTPMKYQAGGSGIHRPVANQNTGKGSKVVGQEYKSKKAKGDMKKIGKHDPYAYVPLNRQQLNKRNSKKPAGQWHTLIDAAKKGAKKGGKAKGQNKQHKKKR